MNVPLRRLTALLLTACLLLGGLSLSAAAQAPAAGAAPETTDDDVLVLVPDTTGQTELDALLEAAGCRFAQTLLRDDGLCWVLAKTQDGQTVNAAIAQLVAGGAVLDAQPNYVYLLPDDAPEAPADTGPFAAPAPDDTGATLAAVPVDDPLADGAQWHLEKIDVFGAWAELNDVQGERVCVAVLDTPIQLDHSDLAGNLLAGLAADFSRDGTQKPYSAPLDGHGTHVAGLVGALANNALGGVGVGTGTANQVLQLLPVNLFAYNDSGQLTATTSAMVAGIRYAVACGADVINMSFGYFRTGSPTTADRTLQAAVTMATDGGIPVVCAAGNNPLGGLTTTFYPSDFAGAMGVISLSQSDTRSPSSNYGEAKFISAPGETLPSTVQGSGYDEKSGTSMAAPLVSGVAAMMLYADRYLDLATLQDMLATTAADLYATGKDPDSGHGRVNAAAAVAAAKAAGSTAAPATGLVLSHSDLALAAGQSITLQAGVLPRNSARPAVQFTSSHPHIASVHPDSGQVSALGPGEATITATAAGGPSASCAVTVTQPVTGISLGQASATLRVGGGVRLEATVLPENASDPTLHWASDAPDIARVSGTGYVEALAIGVATITVTSADGGFTAQCLLTVETAEPGTILAEVDTYDGTPASPLISWTIDANTASFVRLDVTDPDGWCATLQEFTDYTRTSGSVILTLTEGYLAALAPGHYQADIHFIWGSVHTTFTILADDDDDGDDTSGNDVSEAVTPPGYGASPQTGDAARLAHWALPALISVAGLCASAWALARRRARGPASGQRAQKNGR
ncbi:MAG: S8 family serine peptidase [Oscillospiraceae bacterium]